jgi:hypothetical protein
MGRMTALAVCLLALSGVVNAEIVPVSQTLNYMDNLDPEHSAYFFWLPTETIDHPPYYRMSNEDWGWTHDMTAQVPAGVTGIDAATLSILAWDVDSAYGERDFIYANGTKIGELVGDVATFSTTTFTLPSNVLAALWNDSDLDVYIDIDHNNTGRRVNLASSTLAVDYITGAVPEPGTIGLLSLGSLALLRRRRSRA